MPIKRAKQLLQKSAELQKQSTEAVQRARQIVRESKVLQQDLKIRARVRAAGAS